MTAPATPLSLAFVPLDRKFCAPDFRRVCFFVTPGDGSTTSHVVHAACQKSNILILLKITARPETWWDGPQRDFRLPFPTNYQPEHSRRS